MSRWNSLSPPLRPQLNVNVNANANVRHEDTVRSESALQTGSQRKLTHAADLEIGIPPASLSPIKPKLVLRPPLQFDWTPFECAHTAAVKTNNLLNNNALLLLFLEIQSN